VLVGFFVYSLREQTGGFKGTVMKADFEMTAEQESVLQAVPEEKARQKAAVSAPADKKAKVEPKKPPAGAGQVKSLARDEADEKLKKTLASKDAMYDIAPKSAAAPKGAVKEMSAAGFAMKAEGSAAPVMDLTESDYEGIVSPTRSVVVKAAASAAPEPVLKVFRDEKSWNEFAGASGIKTDKKPDFSSEMVVFVSAGEKPSAGYGIEITGVDYGTEKVTVYYRGTKPAAGSMNAQVITYPYAVKIVKKSGLAVVLVAM